MNWGIPLDDGKKVKRFYRLYFRPYILSDDSGSYIYQVQLYQPSEEDDSYNENFAAIYDDEQNYDLEPLPLDLGKGRGEAIIDMKGSNKDELAEDFLKESKILIAHGALQTNFDEIRRDVEFGKEGVDQMLLRRLARLEELRQNSVNN